MGTSRTSSELAGKIVQAGKNLDAAQVDALKAGTRVMARYLQGGAVIDAGGDSVLSNVGRGAKLGVRSNVRRQGRIGASALLAPGGPWWLADLPTRGHFITSRRGGGRAGRAQRLGGLVSGRKGSAEAETLLAVGPVSGRGRVVGAINIPGVGWRAYAQHRGTKGKHGWQLAKARGQGPATKAMAAPATKAVARAFG